MSKRVATKGSDIIGLHLEMHEWLRAELARKAVDNGQTLSRELTRRLENSLSVDAMQPLQDIIADMTRAWSRLRKQVQAVD